MWTGFFWLRIGSSDIVVWTRRNLRSIKGRHFNWVTFSYREVLCCRVVCVTFCAFLQVLTVRQAFCQHDWWTLCVQSQRGSINIKSISRRHWAKCSRCISCECYSCTTTSSLSCHKHCQNFIFPHQGMLVPKFLTKYVTCVNFIWVWPCIAVNMWK